MATPGSVLLNAAGNRVLNAVGKVQLNTSSSDTPDNCCCECPCDCMTYYVKVCQGGANLIDPAHSLLLVTGPDVVQEEGDIIIGCLILDGGTSSSRGGDGSPYFDGGTRVSVGGSSGAWSAGFVTGAEGFPVIDSYHYVFTNDSATDCPPTDDNWVFASATFTTHSVFTGITTTTPYTPPVTPTFILSCDPIIEDCPTDNPLCCCGFCWTIYENDGTATPLGPFAGMILNVGIATPRGGDLLGCYGERDIDNGAGSTAHVRVDLIPDNKTDACTSVTVQITITDATGSAVNGVWTKSAIDFNPCPSDPITTDSGDSGSITISRSDILAADGCPEDCDDNDSCACCLDTYPLSAEMTYAFPVSVCGEPLSTSETIGTLLVRTSGCTWKSAPGPGGDLTCVWVLVRTGIVGARVWTLSRNALAVTGAVTNTSECPGGFNIPLTGSPGGTGTGTPN